MKLLLYTQLPLQNAVRGCYTGVGKATKFSLDGESRSALAGSRVFLDLRLQGISSSCTSEDGAIRPAKRTLNVKRESLYRSCDLLHSAPAILRDRFIVFASRYAYLVIALWENDPERDLSGVPSKGRSQTSRHILTIASGVGGYDAASWIDWFGTTGP